MVATRRSAMAGGLAFALAEAAGAGADAQFSTVNAKASPYTPQQVAGFSKAIEYELGHRGARVAMVFRAGRARASLPPGLSYTHGAFWVYRLISAADGAQLHGYAVYNLFAGDGRQWPQTQSRLVQDWPYNFTAGTFVDDVGIIIPTPEMQRRILAVIDSPDYERLHIANYSLVANPMADRYQNCTDFMLDVVAAAAWRTADPAQLRANLLAHFRPARLQVGPVQRLLAPLADPRIRTDDQRGAIVTATFESLAAFMRQNNLSDADYVFKLNAPA